MKTPINKISFFSVALLFLVLCVNQAIGQSLSLFDIDASNFPTIKAKFYAFDAAGKQILNLSSSDFELLENGVKRNVTFVSCPTPQPPIAISSVLTIDISGSMKGQGIVNAKAASMAWVEGLQLGNSECALTTFNTQNYFIQDFTIDKNKLLNAIIGFGTEGGTDFNAGFIKPMGGALLVAEKGKYKKVVVFITDGMAIGMESSIILKAKSKNITVYCVTLNMQCPSILRNIATQTGGQWFEKVTTKEKAEEVYRMILQSSLGLEPCEIEWESGVPCIAEIRNVELQIKNFGIKVTSNYQIPITSEAKLEFNPNIVKFLNPEVGVKIEEKVTVTARNDNFTVLNITGNNAAFTISPTNFLLKEGESEEFTISYLPFDSAYNNCKFEIESEKCPISFYASGGYRGKKPNVQSLKLTHPNGGETFVVGSDSLITWEGIPPSEKVILEYSADKGQNWKSIIRNVSGLSYNWKNIPGPTSKQCLVRVSQSERLDGSDPIDSPPKIEWQQIYGGSHTEIAKTFTKTRDGGYIVAGFTWSKDGDITHQNGYNDFLILKLRFDGSLEWQKTYGGSRFDEANSIQQTTDGGYIVAGFTDSHDGDVTEEKGYNDIWLLKLSRDGILEWQKSYGGSLWEVPNSIKETSDGGYIVTGTTSSSDGDITEQKGHGDAWVLKLSINGNIEWQKTYGGKESDLIACIQKTKDGGYIVVGYTVSNDGDVIMNKGHDDLWVLKLRIDGSIKWQKTFGGGNSDRGTFIQVTSDGGYIVAGWTYSIDGDVTEYKGSADIWVLKIGIDGSLEWQKSYGGSGEDIAYSIKESSYGGYILVGTTESNDGDVTEFKGDIDIWVLKLSLDGNIEWQKTLGGSYIDRAYSSQETGDGGYILAGSAALNDGDVIENLGGADVWIVKLAGTTILQSDVSDAVFSIVELIASSRDIDMLQVLVGSAKDSVVSEFVSNIGSWKFRVDSIYIQGADASAFSLVSGFPVYTIESKQNHFAEFRFVPSRVGIHSAEIVIDTQGETIVQSIIGEGVDPQLQIINSFIDFGAINVGEMVDTLKAVTVKNNSNAPLEILNTKHNYPNNVDFSTINGGGSFTLQPGETHLMDLRFAPSSLGRTSGTLEFHYDGVGSPAIVQLFGTGHLEPKIISFSPLCVGDLLYLFTNEVYKGRYHWMGPNKYTSEQRYVVIPNAQLHHSGRYSLYIEIEGAMTDTTYFDVLVNENIVTPNDESLVFLGNTKRDDLHIELTEAKLYNSGAVWMKEKFSFKKDFVTEFKFNYTHGNNGGSEETSLPGADGLAFVILNEFNPALGEKGGDIGYTGFRNSMAIEIDLFHNAYDPNGNHIAIQSMGPEPNTANHSIKESTLGMNKNIMLLEQDTVYFVKIMYSYVHKRLNIYLNNERTFNEPVLTLEEIDLPEFLNLEDGEFGYVGFTSATGRAFQVHNIYDWIVPCKNSPLSVYETPKSKQGIVRISPNPAENMLEVDLNLAEEGQIELLIYNMQGEKVKELYKQTVGSLGTKSLKSDISDLSSGQYYLVLITPTYITTKNLVIMR